METKVATLIVFCGAVMLGSTASAQICSPLPDPVYPYNVGQPGLAGVAPSAIGAVSPEELFVSGNPGFHVDVGVDGPAGSPLALLFTFTLGAPQPVPISGIPYCGDQEAMLPLVGGFSSRFAGIYPESGFASPVPVPIPSGIPPDLAGIVVSTIGLDPAGCIFVTNGFRLGTREAAVLAANDVTPGQTGNEPNNAVVNPQNPSQVAVMQGCTVRISNDFGQTFPVVRNTTLGLCNGDPSMAFDSQGRLFVSHLSRSFGANELTVVAGQIADTTTPGTQSYTPVQVSVTDGNDDDKQWLAADANPTSPYSDNLYLVWTQLGPSQINFSRSLDQGVTWSAPQQLDPGGQGFVWPSHIAVAINGDVYISYHTDTCADPDEGTVPLLRDGSGGANFAAGIVPQVNNAFGAGEATVTCNVQSNPPAGTEVPGFDSWLQGTVQPWILPDPLNPANVYVVCNDDPDNAYGSGDDANIVIARSTDYGVTFTVGRVDHGPGQTLAVIPTAHIDQDGKIAVSWYDNRRGLMNTGANANSGSPNFLLDLYGTTSVDGGLTFANDFRINDAPFDPDVNAPCRFGALNTNDCTTRIGEYNGLWTVDALGYVTWTGNATAPAAPFPADGAGAQTTIFDLFSMDGAFPDRLEPSESRDFAVAAALGADDTYNEPDLTIHSATDVDFFRVEALHSGRLEVTIQFNEIVSGLDIEVQDATGNLIVAGTTAPPVQIGSSETQAVIPVVQGQDYFVRIFDSNGPGTFAPQSTYDLTIVNRPAPVPFGPDLIPDSDTGRDNRDNVTFDNTPTVTFLVNTTDPAAEGIDLLSPAEVALGEDGYAVAVFNNGVQIGYATQTAGSLWSFTPAAPLLDGIRSLTAKVEVFDDAASQASGTGGESDSIIIEIDTTAPAPPSTPDLLASSDSGGIDDDNVTTIMSPAFDGIGEANALVRIAADGDSVGEGVVTSGGTYEVTVEPLADDFYDVSGELEDLAGNVSSASTPLRVTIANQVLTLHGGTTGPANATVEVSLADGTVDGYPGAASASGLIGIVGIPRVNLDVNGQALTITGTPNADDIHYTPSGSQSGELSRAGSSQVLAFDNAAGTFTIDPLGGSDTTTVIGTSSIDNITTTVDVTTSVQVNAMKILVIPTSNTERIGISSGHGADEIEVTALDTINANLVVDAADPSSNPPNSDVLSYAAGSPNGKSRKQPGGGGEHSGSIFVEYPQTTGNATRIDYSNVEVLRKL